MKKACATCGREFRVYPYNAGKAKYCSRRCMPPKQPAPIEQNFEAHVTYVPESGCHLWTGCLNNKGYGQIRIAKRAKLAHRVAWEQKNGPIPEGLFVCHKCDTPSCVNPDHLFLGTTFENLADASAKGRMRHGIRHHNAKLDDAKVRDIRVMSASGMCQREIGECVGISQTVVGDVLRREIWAHVT